MASNKGLDSELESFRQQWLSEVRTKQGPHPSSSSSITTTTHAAELVSSKKPKARSRAPSPSSINNRKAAPAIDVPSHEQDESSHSHGPFENDVGAAAAAAAAAEPPGAMVDGSVRASAPLGKELVSALDFYEEAMAKEAEGNMGDSLKLYRQAYRLDSRVDRRYREKHFPAPHKPQHHAHISVPDQQASASPTAAPPPSSASAQIVVLPIKDLLASFSNLLIQPAPPPHMFQHRPRIRFNGCYISTVNYIRMGQASAAQAQATWGGSPVHIVTYYRYLRFFRDGTAISLLTTAEPAAVVGHLTREALLLHLGDRNKNTHASLPSAIMQKAYRGRWRLSCSSALDHGIDDDGHDGDDDGGRGQSSSGPLRQHSEEGDLTVETETHDPKYMFRMDLSLRTAGKGARNNKLVWQSHYSYNKLTDDWAEFTLKHDKAFLFSRVRSYGMGGQEEYL
ncbi:hypothetical protein E4U43_002434 [Claviceps pusilla]|uniref:F-box protein Hrt3/FBXO9 C-terminal domain-containing protein n=1 Tax=Claviceps pusilla TaxID=123648 RepID=A0A9P7N6A8_9HYPO|nr:hypothetical protein E4U43_002434 [Claviceps pusilla]